MSSIRLKFDHKDFGDFRLPVGSECRVLYLGTEVGKLIMMANTNPRWPNDTKYIKFISNDGTHTKTAFGMYLGYLRTHLRTYYDRHFAKMAIKKESS